MWAVNRNVELGKVESAWLVPAAGVLLAAGLLLIGVAAISFVRARTTINPLRPSHASSLITTGLFGLSRNPIYLGDLLILAAYAVWLGQAINVVFLALFVCYINRFQIQPEEHALAHRFGERYADYCSRVRRWL